MHNLNRFYPARHESTTNAKDFKFEPVSLEDIPRDVVQKAAERRSDRFKVSPNIVFDEARIVSHADGSKTYALNWVRPQNDTQPKIEVIYVVDVVDGGYAGIGEILFSENKEPYVGDIETEFHSIEGDELLHRGLAERRYSIMNVICEDKNLNSGVLNNQSEELWEKMVQRGDAVLIGKSGDGRGRYRMT